MQDAALKEIVEQVDPGRLYSHVLSLEGTRNPIENPERLDQMAEYIKQEFFSFGLSPSFQEFKVDDFDLVFRNVEALLEAHDSHDELIICAHYDTIEDCPGADDNASGVAVMLEAARILSKAKPPISIRFLGFTLEESNPSMTRKTKDIERRLGIKDAKGRYVDYKTSRTQKEFWKRLEKKRSSGRRTSEAIDEIRQELKSSLSQNEDAFAEEITKMYGDLAPESWPGKIALIGSSEWLRARRGRTSNIQGVLCLETLGYTSQDEGSQRVPEGLSVGDADITIGNFLSAISDANSGKILDSFCANSLKVDLRVFPINVPLKFAQIATVARDLVRSDHAPFWREDIPALMLTDTANFRNPYYHTSSDTIDKLDFEFMSRVCKAVVATCLRLKAES